MTGKSNLKNIAAKGLFWSAIERFGSQGIQFVFGIFITRLLAPEDYGLFGMILIFMGVGLTLVDSGFGSALIWKKSPTENDYSTVFYFNISISTILYTIFFFLAPFISRFYNEPILVNLIRVICLNFIILSFSLIQQTILQKRVDFKLLAHINIASSLLAGIVALYMAFKGFGVWSIVLQILIKSFITSFLLWIYNKWRPVFSFSWISLKELFNYGSKLTLAGLIYTIFQNFYFNVIGKLFPVEALGFYTRAVQLQEFPVKTGVNIFNRVVFPVFATIQNDTERLKNAVRKSLRTMVFIMFPVIFGLIAIADDLIIVLLTDKWLPASEYFKLICLSGIFYIFQIINGEVLKTKGKLGWVLKLEIVSKIIMIISVFFTWRWGIKAIIYGQLFTITIIVTYLFGGYYVWRLIGYSVLQQLNDILKYFIISIEIYFIVISITYFINNSYVSLIIACLSGVTFYIIASLILKLDEVQEIRKMLKKDN